MLPLLFPWQAILSLTVTGNLQGADFIRGGPANDWIESFRPPGVPEFGGAESQYAEFDQIYNNAGITIRPPLDGRCLDFSFFFFDLMFVCVPHCTYNTPSLLNKWCNHVQLNNYYFVCEILLLIYITILFCFVWLLLFHIWHTSYPICLRQKVWLYQSTRSCFNI